MDMKWGLSQICGPCAWHPISMAVSGTLGPSVQLSQPGTSKRRARARPSARGWQGRGPWQDTEQLTVGEESGVRESWGGISLPHDLGHGLNLSKSCFLQYLSTGAVKKIHEKLS